MRQALRPHAPLRAIAAAALFAFTLPATAQLSSATVRGSVTANAAAQAGATVTATNIATGQVSRTTSRADGGYTLVGLAPGSYRIESSAPGFGSRTETLTVLVGQSVDLDLPLAAAGVQQLETVVISGTAGRDRKTSEVGTNITSKQIEALPQNSRNFLAFADLAPGVRVDTDPRTGQIVLRSGAQNRDNVNVFIDGVGQKNYILRGGMSGLDASRGNPFPQSAIGEYKVLSSNYKAEFDQVSSTAITAVTKSGTNELHGEAFIDRTSVDWRAYSPFEKKAKDQGVDRQPAHQPVRLRTRRRLQAGHRALLPRLRRQGHQGFSFGDRAAGRPAARRHGDRPLAAGAARVGGQQVQGGSAARQGRPATV